MSKHIMKSVVCCLISLSMVFELAGGALAYAPGSKDAGSITTAGDNFLITDKDGNTTEVDESWEAKYPYGIFVLENSELSTSEDGQELVLTVFRLGGAKGKASAIFQYMPAVLGNQDGTLNFYSALSADDVELTVEKPLAITRYQQWGMPEAPEVSGTVLKAEAGVDGEGEECTLIWPNLTKEAEKYEWYALYDEEWMLVESSDTGKLPVSDEDLQKYDFRCVYTQDKVRFCTTSFNGVKYEKPEPEVLEEMPEDIVLNETPTYQALDLYQGSSVYDGMLFELCFAEGELQKEIHIKAKGDDIAEADEFATFTMLGSIGGEVMKSMNTTLLRVEANDMDNDAPSQIGFDAAEISFDKSIGTASLSVTRTGSLVKALSVDWATVSGTAVSGKDYVESSGTLYFAAGQSTAELEIELVNDKIEQTEEKTLTVELSNLRGNGDDSSSISDSQCVVGLYNTNTAESTNLASELYNVAAVDVSNQVVEQADAQVATGEISGTQVSGGGELDTLDTADSKCEIDWERKTLDPLLWEYNYGWPISFSGGSWGATHYLNVSHSGNGTQSPTFNTTSAEYIGKMYTGFSTSFTAYASFRNWTDFWYGNDEIATTRFMFETSGSNSTWTYDPGLYKDGATMYYAPKGNITASKNWGYNDYDYNSGTFYLGLVPLGNDGKPGAETMNVSSKIGLNRRTIDGDIYLKCFTANDEDVQNSDIAKYASVNYSELISDISITDGGAKDGKLYEGSTVKITLESSNLVCTGARIYNEKTGKADNNSVISGNTVTFTKIMVEPGSENSYSMQLFFQRKQNIDIDISTSTDPDNMNASGYNSAYELMLGRMNKKTITVGYSPESSYNVANGTGAMLEKNIDLSGHTGLSQGSLSIATTDTPNIQWVNFNLPEDDLIVINKKAYPGNAKIWLKRANLMTGNLTFYYYQKDFLTTVRPMVAKLDAAAIYYDGDGNGQIDGYFDAEAGSFVVDDASGDRFVAFADGDYNETQFRPTLGSDGKLRQYFIRQYYTANPVAMVLPEGASADERMQVTPNFITSITNEAAYSKLTPEQKSYRAVVSGKTRIMEEGAAQPSDYDYSADNHVKYGAEATAYSYVDIPLGGDAAPCHQMTNTELGKAGVDNQKVSVGGQDYMINNGLVYYFDGTTTSGIGAALFAWNSNFCGSLLKNFASPSLIYIEHNELGDNIPVTNETEMWYQLKTGEWTTTAPTDTTRENYQATEIGLYITEERATAKGKIALNEYLGSLRSNDTYALIVAEQEKNTDEIINGLGTLEDKAEPDKKPTISIGKVGVIPDSQYMLSGDGKQTGGGGGSDGQGEMEELNLSVKNDLTTFSAEGLALFGAETDGLEVTLTIGIPLYGKDNGGGTGSSASNTFDDIGETAEKLKNFWNAAKEKKSRQERNKALAPEELLDENLSSKSIEFSVGLSAAITLKYNPMDNTFMFNKLAVILSVGFEIRLQHRFSFCPLLYVYFQFSAEVSIQSGFTREREAVYQSGTDSVVDNKTITLNSDNNNKNLQYWFSTPYKGFGIKFKGKLYVECHEYTEKNSNSQYDPGVDELNPKVLEGTKPGYITSDGESITDVILLQKDGMMLDKNVVVILSYVAPKNADGTSMTAEQREKLSTEAKQTDITGIYRITDIEDNYFWNGFSFNIELGIEAGLGIGIEIVKAEVYIHAGVEFGFTLGVYDREKDKYGPAQVDSFGLSAGVGVRALFLFFSFEMELAEYHLNYDSEEDKDGQDVVSNSGWSHGWSALGGNFGGDDNPLSLQGTGGSSIMRIKSPSAVSEEIYEAGIFERAEETDTLAVDSNTEDFQVSGYGSSSNAFRLFNGTETGYDYKIVTIGNYNYLVFTYHRTGTAGVDKTMLAVSKIIETDDAYGRVNPIAGKATDTQNWYIPVDDDKTGDLDFTAWAEGSNIHVTWVNYKTATTVPTKPSASGAYDDTSTPKTFTATSGGEGFTYNGTAFTAEELTAGTASITEVTSAAQPVETDYYSETEVAGFTKITEGTGDTAKDWWLASAYTTLAEAQAAYTTANNAYLSYTAYTEAKASLKEWSDYYAGADEEAQLIEASKNTEVKTAVFNTEDTNSTGFSTPVTLGTGVNYKFLPTSASGLTAYAQSVPYTSQEMSNMLTEYRQFVIDTNDTGTVALDPNSYTYKHMAAEVDYRVAMQKAMYNLYGCNSTITISATDGTAYADGTVYVSRHSKDGDGTTEDKTDEILTAIDMTAIGDTYYLAYVTQQEAVVKDATSQKYTDSRTIQRLYLRSFTVAKNDDTAVGAPENKLVWGEPYLLRTAVNYESSSDKDGLYDSSLSRTAAYTDPYISGTSFLNGVIGSKLSGENEEFQPFDEETAEEFLIFEMNGDTYVIKQADIQSITSSGSGAIIPFFTYKQRYGKALQNEGSGENLSSGKNEVVIGADGSGNVAAVYTATVPNTSNNAIYIAYWDPVLLKWSDGAMLAMNNMQVYENAAAEGWDNKTTAEAYLDAAKGGDMTQLRFSNLVVALGRGPKGELGGAGLDTQEADVSVSTGEAMFGEYLTKLGVNLDADGELAGLSNYSAAELYALREQLELMGADVGALQASSPELLVIAQGTKTELEKRQVGSSSDYVVVAKTAGDGDNSMEPANVGVYAISYGKGSQQVGNVALSFAYNEFTASSRLYAKLSFKNVGDAAIRVNNEKATNIAEKGPVTVTLKLRHGGVDTDMASWKIYESIASGQSVSLSTDTAPCKTLTDNLVAGDYFYITVSEDSYFGDGAYNYNSSDSANPKGCGLKYTIEDKPELGVEKFTSAIAGVDDKGNASVDVSFDVTNRGGKKAEGVFAQFSYVSGYTQDGEEIYTPLDLTNSELYVSQQRYITGEFGTLDKDDLANGIIYLGTDEKFYTRDYYISKAQFDDILAQHYSLNPVSGWVSGIYNETRYYYNPVNYISAYAAYTAGQTAVAGWKDAGDNTHYYNSAYASFSAAQAAAEAARKMEYVLNSEQYSNLTPAQKVGWKSDGGSYIPIGYANLAAAEKAYEAAKSDATDSIDKSYCRTVEGTFSAAPALFKGNLTGSLNIKVEVFSDSSNVGLNGAIKTSEHEDEYYSHNNSASAQLEQKTYISAANRITLPVNGTQRLPVSVRTTTGEAPEISVYEVYDGVGLDEDSNGDELGMLYYEPDTDGDSVPGTQTGSLYITGLRLGSGVIHIKDVATNETYPIAYTVQAEGDGINIFNDNSMFTFYNADGTKFDPDKTNQDWEFGTYLAWPDGKGVTYLDNLAVAKDGAYFTFKTKASTVNLSLQNDAEVRSDAFIASGYIYGGDGSYFNEDYAIDFLNDTSVTHTVTVTARNENEATYFDTLILGYDEEYKPSDDKNSPGLYFSRSFPAAGSIQSGTAVNLTVYAVDDSGLASLRFNGAAASGVKRTDSGLWEYTFDVTQNGSFTVAAADKNGNTTTRSITVDWFYSGEKPVNTEAVPPALAATIEKHYKGNTKPNEDLYAVGANVTFTSEDAQAANTIEFNASTTDAGALLTYYAFNKKSSAFEEMKAGDTIPYNGYYMVKASNASHRTLSQKIFYVSCFENLPTITVKMRANTNTWDWVATKDEESTASLKSVTLNGIELDTELALQSKSSVSGSLTLPYGGEYTFKATDTKDITGINKLDISVPVTPEKDAISVNDAWGQPDNSGALHGTITVDFSKVSGGDFANTEPVESLSQLVGSYEYTVIKTEEAGGAIPGDGSESPNYTWLDSLTWKPSSENTAEVTAKAEDKTEYTVIIRDSNNKTEYATMAAVKVSVDDKAIDVLSLSAGLASGETAADGRVYIVADGGETGYYQFAMLPAGSSLTAESFKADTVQWHNASWIEGIPGYGELEGVVPGEYQIAIRAFYNGGTEKTAVGELFALGTAIDKAQAALDAFMEARASAATSMEIAIEDASRAWRTASEDTEKKQAAYDKLMAASPVDTAAADAAYDALTNAKNAEDVAKAAYIAALGSASTAERDKLIGLRGKWLSLGTGAEADAAYSDYAAAVKAFCEEYQKGLFEDRISGAQLALTNASDDYDAKSGELTAAAKTQYLNNPEKWDGMLTGADTKITVEFGTATSLKAIPSSSMPSSPTGSISVTAEGGKAYDGGSTIHYQFAVLPLEDGKKLDFTGKMASIADLGLKWQFADDMEKDPQKAVLEELSAGTYQVFVRQVFDPNMRDSNDTNESIYKPGDANCLYALLKDYQTAEANALPAAVKKLETSAMTLFAAFESSGKDADRTAFLDYVGNDAEAAAKLLAWENAEKTAKDEAKNALTKAASAYFTTQRQAERDAAYLVYSTKLNQINSEIDRAYSQTPGYYDTVSYTLATVGTVPQSAIISTVKLNNKVTYQISGVMELTPEDAKNILAANAENEVVLVREKVKIVIPAGMLNDAAEIQSILGSFKNGNGNVVSFTAPDGKTCIVPSIVENGNVAFLYIGKGSYAVTENRETFKDTQGHWAEDSINFTAGLTLFTGVGENMFNPEGRVNRAMAVTVLYRMVGSPKVSGTTPFVDVPENKWYSDAILWAYQNKVVDGMTSTSFAPMLDMTREQLVTVIHRFLKSYGLAANESGSLGVFTDSTDVSAYARDAFEWAVAAKIISGVSEDLLAPGNNATRAQIATIYERLTHYILG